MATSWKDAPKDPEDVRDYAYDWSADMPAEVTIATSVWTVVSGDVTIVQDSHNNTVSTVRLGGGTVPGSPSVLNCHVVLSDGQELDVDNSLKIAERITK